jgi:SNF2 family DNA or RNA helicase
MPPKTEVTLQCPLSRRQAQLYAALKARLNVADLFVSDAAKMKRLLNLVIQLRKVCLEGGGGGQRARARGSGWGASRGP